MWNQFDRIRIEAHMGVGATVTNRAEKNNAARHPVFLRVK